MVESVSARTFGHGSTGIFPPTPSMKELQNTDRHLSQLSTHMRAHFDHNAVRESVGVDPNRSSGGGCVWGGGAHEQKHGSGAQSWLGSVPFGAIDDQSRQ